MSGREAVDNRLGIVGAGKIGPAVARAAVASGYDVAISGSGAAERIELIVDVLAPGAHAVTTDDVVRHADLIVLAVPMHRFRELPRDLFAGKILVDTAFSDTIRGFGGHDVAHGLAGPDLIGGGSGVDKVFAGRGDDTIRGGPRRDRLFNGQGADTVYGGAGHDLLFDGQGADTIYGGAGRDSIDGAAGSDVIFGGVGADGIFDGQGTDTIYGGLGNDTVFLDKDGTSDTVHCGPGHDVVYGATPGENTIAADCEGVHVMLPHDRGLPSSPDRTARPNR